MPRNLAGRKALYDALRTVRVQYTEIMQDAISRINDVLVRSTDVDGKVLLIRLDDVVEAAGQIVAAKFSNGRKVFATDGITALSPFAAMLNYQIAAVTVGAVAPHAKHMRENLPDDLRRWLSTGHATEQVRTTNPLAQYEPAHTWVDPKGYQLSDRIWRAGQNVRLRMDELLADGIRSGRSAVDLSKDLEAFLLPGKGLKTNKPYGTNVSYHGMVLARSEIARAHSAATFAASAANPFVDGMDWALSASHPKFDICDGLATIGMGGERLKPPYPLDDAPMVVRDSHPQCLCVNRAVVTETPTSVIATLRAQLNGGSPAPLNPLNVAAFIRALLGDRLTNLVSRLIAIITGAFA